MGKLKNKLELTGVALATSAMLFGGSGCLTSRGDYYAEQLGAAATQQFISNSLDQSMGVNRGTEVNVYNRREIPKNVYITDEGKYCPAPGYNWVNPNNPKDLRVMPENVYITDEGKYCPAPGYNWVNPNNPKDLRVRKE